MISFNYFNYLIGAVFLPMAEKHGELEIEVSKLCKILASQHPNQRGAYVVHAMFLLTDRDKLPRAEQIIREYLALSSNEHDLLYMYLGCALRAQNKDGWIEIRDVLLSTSTDELVRQSIHDYLT